MSRRSTALALAVAGCQAPDASSLSAAIVNGTVDSADPGVVAIVQRRTRCDEPPSLVCSGVLVSPRVVLTAAHCARLDGDVGGYEVAFGASLADPAAVFVVTSDSRVYPGFDDAANVGEFALLRLSESAPVAPLSLPDAMPALTVGDAVRAVGFGAAQPGVGPDGVKRTGAMTISAISVAAFEAVPGPAVTCAGDSGGPVFWSANGIEILVALTVAGDPGCATFAINDRLDDPAVRDFVAGYVAESATAPVGPSATATVSVEQACSTRCNGNDDCPDLMVCDPLAPGGPRCVVRGAIPVDLAEPCAVASECGDDGYCARQWPSGPDACRCAIPCGSLHTPSGCCAAAGGGGGTLVPAVLVMLGLLRARRRSAPPATARARIR